MSFHEKYYCNVNWHLAPLIVLILSTTLPLLGQTSQKQTWTVYEPDPSLFSMKVPGVPSTAQGHIFDPETEAIAYKFFDGGLCSRIYNFEIVKGTSRSFLVSILYIQTRPATKLSPVTAKEADGIDMTVGDEVVRSRIEKLSTATGTVSKWSYGKRVESKLEDRGRVFAMRSKNSLVFVVVDYDFASPDDPEIGLMLNSLSVRK